MNAGMGNGISYIQNGQSTMTCSGMMTSASVSSASITATDTIAILPIGQKLFTDPFL